VLQDLISIAIAAIGAGLVALSVKQARSKGAAGSLQLAAGGLLLIGASAVGVVGFVAGIALSPLAWLGIVALALAGVLFVVGQRLEGRASRSKAATVDSGRRPPQSAVTGKPASAEADDDMADIEAILKKHGIT
jgi:hypothetical protein